MKGLFAGCVVSVLVCAATAADSPAPVRVSFLDSEPVLRDTVRLLRAAGCDANNLERFARAVREYNSSPCPVDRSRFPPATNGLHSFASPADFVAALPGHFSQIDRPFGMNCMLTVALIAGSQMTVRPDARSLPGPFLAAATRVDGQPWLAPVVSLDDAWAVTYHTEYFASVTNIVGADFSERHGPLVASIHSFHALPVATNEKQLPLNLMAALSNDWARVGLTFPKGLKLVLLHRATLVFPAAVTDHAGLLVPRDCGVTYLEKAGGRGPFIRMDLVREDDVSLYHRATLQRWPDNLYSHSFVTLNGESIHRVTDPAPADPGTESTEAAEDEVQDADK